MKQPVSYQHLCQWALA